MKITITQDFDSAEAAAAFIAKVTGQPAEPVVTAAAGEGATVSPSPAAPVASGRKPRSDAGKKREPYGPRTTTGEPPASEPGTVAVDSAAVATPAAKAPPPISSAPTPPVQPGSTPGAESAAEEPEFPATLDGARAALKKLNDVPGKGMDACIAALKAHGVNRISDPALQEKYAEFIKYVLGQIPQSAAAK